MIRLWSGQTWSNKTFSLALAGYEPHHILRGVIKKFSAQPISDGSAHANFILLQLGITFVKKFQNIGFLRFGITLKWHFSHAIRCTACVLLWSKLWFKKYFLLPLYYRWLTQGHTHINHSPIDHPYKCHENTNHSRVRQLSKALIHTSKLKYVPNLLQE